ncbi:MAG TPA: class I SAM-dependent methyltransferase, partial [Acidimicrobiales bacterium]
GGGNVIDLGCGNGALLGRMAAAAPGVIPFGVDVDAQRIEHARQLHAGHADNIVSGDIFDSDQLWVEGRRFALAVLMPGRLLETDEARAAALRERLSQSCDRVLVYAYGDWLTRAGDLAGLAREAGLTVVGPGRQPVALVVMDGSSSRGNDG